MFAQAFELTGLSHATSYQSLIREVRGCAPSLELSGLGLDFPGNREINREIQRFGVNLGKRVPITAY